MSRPFPRAAAAPLAMGAALGLMMPWAMHAAQGAGWTFVLAHVAAAAALAVAAALAARGRGGRLARALAAHRPRPAHLAAMAMGAGAGWLATCAACVALWRGGLS
ncbi:MAG: hypothetical protein ACU0BS_06895 [Hasllibacter sp.]